MLVNLFLLLNNIHAVHDIEDSTLSKLSPHYADLFFKRDYEHYCRDEAVNLDLEKLSIYPHSIITCQLKRRMYLLAFEHHLMYLLSILNYCLVEMNVTFVVVVVSLNVRKLKIESKI